jgi:vanillate O-demethylase ferredoxin subunit
MTARLVMRMRVEAAEPSTPEVMIYTLAHPTRPVLPEAPPGSHVDLRLPDGRVRQYSLCGDPADRSRWRIAVKREDAGRGVSRWCHEALCPGAPVLVSAPRNNFPLAPQARRHLLVAGGIGVTPLAAMARHLAATGADFTLHFAARSAGLAPLLPELRAICGERLVTWFGAEGRRLDPAALLGPPEEGTHLYACGPDRLTEAVRAGAGALGWPEERVHVELFQATLDENFKPEPFDILLASSGERLRVPADRSALEVLREHGLPMPSSCENGLCGACVCGYRDGVVIHRDRILPVGARQDRMTPCVSRARVEVTLEL